MTSPGQHLGLRLRLVKSHEIAPATRHFVFEVPDRDAFGFVPGQFLSLTAEINGKPITRAYSIASPPRGNRADLCLNLVQDGLLSPFLFAMQPGDEIEAKGPYGGFVFRQPADTICVATGTGIAPFRGMLLDRLPKDPDHQYTLIFGARHEHGLLYVAELCKFVQEFPNFHLHTTVTRPTETWTGKAGRVQPILREVIGERRDLAIYICGLKEMVDETRLLLKDAGLDRKQVNFEKYD